MKNSIVFYLYMYYIYNIIIYIHISSKSVRVQVLVLVLVEHVQQNVAGMNAKSSNPTEVCGFFVFFT